MASRELTIDISPLVKQVQDYIRESVEPWATQLRRERIVLQLAIEDIRDHATPMGLLHEDDPEGSPHHYLLTVGALHRALGVLAGGVPQAWEPEIGRRLALLDAALEPDQSDVQGRRETTTGE